MITMLIQYCDGSLGEAQLLEHDQAPAWADEGVDKDVFRSVWRLERGDWRPFAGQCMADAQAAKRLYVSSNT